MKHPLIFLCLIFTILTGQSQNQPPLIQNVSALFNPVTKEMFITYDVSDAEGDSIEVLFRLSEDDGTTFLVDVSSATGDIGFPVEAGTVKKITWVAPEAINPFDHKVRLVADDRQDVDLQMIVDQVDSTRLRSNLEYIAQPRHYVQNLPHLNDVKDTLEATLSAAGLDAYREGTVFAGYNAENIIGRQPGLTEEATVCIIDGHFDAINNTPGADDNGSAVVGVMEAARILSQYQFSKTIKYIFFDLEEIGLGGSMFYVNEGGIRPYESIEGVINFEMIGYFDNTPNSQVLPTGFNLFFPSIYNELQADSFRGNFIINVANTVSNPLKSIFDTCAANYVPSLKVISIAVPGNGELVPDLRRSDHATFWDAGYKALMITDGANFRNMNYHSPGDSVGTLNFSFMQDVVKTGIATLAKMAGIRHSSSVVSEVGLTNMTSISAWEELCDFSLTMENNSLILNYGNASCVRSTSDIKLLDMEGKEVFAGTMNSLQTNFRISTSSMANGVYLLHLHNEKGTFTRKLFLSN